MTIEPTVAAISATGVAPQPKTYHETMPKLELSPNTRMFVKFNPGTNTNVPLQVEFLGASHYEFLILRLPSIPGLVKSLLPRTLIEMSYQNQGAASSFMAEIIKYSAKPVLLLYTSYPERLRVMETRRHKRISCALPAALATPYGDGLAVIKDLSKGGCCLVWEMTGQAGLRQVAMGDRIVMQVSFSPNAGASSGIGVVRNIEVTGGHMIAGVTFDGNSREFAEALHIYLELIKLVDD